MFTTMALPPPPPPPPQTQHDHRAPPPLIPPENTHPANIGDRAAIISDLHTYGRGARPAGAPSLAAAAIAVVTIVVALHQRTPLAPIVNLLGRRGRERCLRWVGCGAHGNDYAHSAEAGMILRIYPGTSPVMSNMHGQLNAISVLMRLITSGIHATHDMY